MVDRIKNILREEFQLSDEILERQEEKLTGKKFGLEPRDMLYFFFLIEREFNIKIEIDEITHYEFNTISGIKNLIADKRKDI